MVNTTPGFRASQRQANKFFDERGALCSTDINIGELTFQLNQAYLNGETSIQAIVEAAIKISDCATAGSVSGVPEATLYMIPAARMAALKAALATYNRKRHLAPPANHSLITDKTKK